MSLPILGRLSLQSLGELNSTEVLVEAVCETCQLWTQPGCRVSVDPSLDVGRSLEMEARRRCSGRPVACLGRHRSTSQCAGECGR